MITRQEINQLDVYETTVQNFKHDEEAILQSLAHQPENLAAFRIALTLLQYSEGLNLGQQESLGFLHLATKMGIAQFISALSLEAPSFQLEHKGKAYPFATDPTQGGITADDWLEVFSAVTILRDNVGFIILTAFDSDQLSPVDASGVSVDPASKCQMDFFQGMFNPEAKIGDLLMRALEAADPTRDGVGHAQDLYFTEILTPLYALYRCFLSDNEAEYQTKLAEALDQHKAFWEAGYEGYEARHRWLAIELVAVACLAYDNRGWVPQTQSEFLPQWMITSQID